MAKPPPTLVSTFEVLFTPQLPPGLGPAAVAQADELVVKGYFITIANPNPAAYTFQLGFHCNVNPSPVPAQRTLASAVGFLDDGSTGNPLTIFPGASGVDFFADVPVAANGTVLVGVLPLFFNAGGLASATIESRGWVDITLPALLKRVGGGRFGFFEFVPQSNAPVTAILTPEQRLTFLPMAGDAATAVEAQGAFSLPIASGQAANAIPPQPGGFPFFDEATAAERELTPQEMAGLSQLGSASPAQQAAMLSAMVAGAPAVAGGRVSAAEAMRALGF